MPGSVTVTFEELAVPNSQPSVNTDIGPELAPSGTLKFIKVFETTVKSSISLPFRVILVTSTKFVPVNP